MGTNDGRPGGSTFTPMECPRAGEHLTPGQARYAEATGRDGACHLCGAGPLRVVSADDEPADDEPADDEVPTLDSLNADDEPPEVTGREDCRGCAFGEPIAHTCGRED